MHTDRRSIIEYGDLIGADRILSTIQEHVLNDDRLRYIELANGSVSMADRSTDDLRRFFFDNRLVDHVSV